MHGQLTTRLRYAAVILIVTTMHLANDNGVLAAAAIGNQPSSISLAEAASAPYPYCSSFCGESRECWEECEVPVGEQWLLTTCGEYDGGASNGWCDPDSCVTTCNDFANCGWECSYGGDAMDCYEYGQCVTCGDDTCVVGIETRANCAADCGYCGDGICQYLDEVMTSQPNWCEQDCGVFDPLSGEDPDCDPIDGNPACEGAMVCTPRGVCEPVAYGGGGGGLCYNNGDCAAHYKCLVFNDIENGAGLCVYNPSPLEPVSTPTSR